MAKVLFIGYRPVLHHKISWKLKFLTVGVKLFLDSHNQMVSLNPIWSDRVLLSEEKV